MTARTGAGIYLTSTTAGESVEAFLPAPLPPRLTFSPADLRLMERANLALGRLDGMAALLPKTDLFLYNYVRKEALLSSQIEGTQSSFSDLLLMESEEAPGVPLEDVREASNYIRALYHGLDRLASGFPLSLRLIREIHEVLLQGGRGADKRPGEFRKSQNWIGGTRPGNSHLVPPPPEHVPEALHSLETFLHDASVPSLIKAALVHVQFETIHPFLDGNGRIGRLLITLLLCEEKVLREPVLYLSLFFKRSRDEYYRLLQRVRTEGDWEAWLRFFFEGVAVTSDEAVDAAARLLALLEQDRLLIERHAGRSAGSTLRVHDALARQPLLSAGAAAAGLQLSRPTVSKALAILQEVGVVREVSGRERNRVFAYDAFLRILSEGAEPLPL